MRKTKPENAMPKAIRVYRHPDCTSSMRLAKRRRQLDWLDRIEDVAAEPPTGPLRLGEIAVQDLSTGAIVRGADAVALLCRHLPVYWWFLPLLHVPARQLSLGQRMRCDLAAVLLHAPPILFLDEPTIGLDVAVKARMRAFISSIQRERGLTLLLTSHDLGDIADLCQRLVMIDGGTIVFDGPLDAVTARFGRDRVVHLLLSQPTLDAGARAQAALPELPDGAITQPEPGVALKPPVPQPQLMYRPLTGVKPMMGQASGETSTMPPHCRFMRTRENSGNISTIACSVCSMVW